MSARNVDIAARDFCRHIARVDARVVRVLREYDQRVHLAILYEPRCGKCSPWLGEDQGTA